MPPKLAILTGGGDCPGLNAVIRATAKTAILGYGAEIIGFEDGYDGLIHNRFRELDYMAVSGILTQGGTILGTSNRANPLRYPIEEDGEVRFEDVTERAVANFKASKADALVVIGGDGTGPEVTAEALKVLEAVAKLEGFGYELTDFDFGGERYLRTGEILPQRAIEELRAHDAIFLGAVGHPDVAPGILEKGLLLELRFQLDQYINLRAVKLYPGVETPLAGKGPADGAVCHLRGRRRRNGAPHRFGHAPRQLGWPQSAPSQPYLARQRDEVA